MQHDKNEKNELNGKNELFANNKQRVFARGNIVMMTTKVQ